MITSGHSNARPFEQPAPISVKHEVLVRPARRAGMFSLLVTAALFAPWFAERLG